jgi:D-glycero-D-manno-heptose 1,7-bisphosphate phosphatase
MNILFLDLDGTVRRSKSGQTFINSPEDQELIPGVREAINQYSDWAIVGITNQGGVAAGKKSLHNCVAEQQRTLEILPKMRSIYFCPDFEGEQCYRVEVDNFRDCSKEGGGFRKPEAGMIRLAIAHLGKPEKALFVGDRPEDELAAARAGIPFIWADLWRV